MNKFMKVFIIVLEILLLSTYIQTVFATTYTRYPPYDVGFSGGGKSEQGGVANYGHYVNLSNGTAKGYVVADAAFIGGAMAEAWGYVGIRWTAPSDGGGGGGGGCPFVYAWNGTNYLIDNNLLPASETSNGTDVEDYYKLQQPLVVNNEKYQLLISEFEQEHSYFDQVQLLAVDHPSNANVALSPQGEILTYTNPSPPVSAIDDNNRNVKSLLASIDGNYYEGYNGSYITLNFGDELDISQGAKLVLRADPKYVLLSVHVQVQDSEGNWNSVASIIPRAYWATEIIDMSKYLPDAKGDLKVRLYFTANHKIDFAGLDTSPQATINVQHAELVSAIHSKEGDVKSKLLYDDRVYAELLPGKQIELAFTFPNNQIETTTFIIYTKGHYVTTFEDDPIITVSSKLTLKGYAEAVAYALNSLGARAKYVFQIWLWVYDLTTGTYVTQTLIYEKSEEAIAPGGFIPDIKSYTWDYDQDMISSFSAIGGHTYDIYIGVRIQAVSDTISIGGCGALVDFDSYSGYGEEKINGYAIVRYISLSW